MAAFYADSSALVKRYVREAGSSWVTAFTLPSAGNVIITALVSGPEIVAALARRVRTGSMTLSDASAAISAFRSEFQTEFEVAQISDEVIERAMDLAERHSLRGYDAVPLACALVSGDRLAARGLPALTFLSADAALNAAAAAEGLPVEDPSTHQ
jgi:predicted nucleic acid-binding protein